MTKLQTTDLIISGAGMTGVALALGASELGLSVELIEPRSIDLDKIDELIAAQRDSDFDARVSALTRASEQLLVNLGVWDDVKRFGAEPYTRMHVWDGESRGEISFDANEVHQPVLGHIVENRWILFALLKAAAKDPGIQITSGVTISELKAASQGSRELILSSGEQRKARLVVGADGAESQTRKMAGLGTLEWDYGHQAVVATLRMENKHQHCCWQRFTADGPLALLPLPDEEQCAVSLVWSTSPEHASELTAMDETEFCQAISQGSGSILGSAVSVSGVQSIRLKQRHAKDYVANGFALVGDAAHTIHPLAGQGVNLGFQDVGELVDQLQAALGRKESIGDLRVLKRYQRARQLENIKMSAAMEGFKRLFEPQPPLIEMGRSIGMRLVDGAGPLKQHLIHQAMGFSKRNPSLLRIKSIG